jgi:hypothetical protein
MHEQNIALLGKLSWDLIHNSSKLWASILQAKYLRGNGLRYSIVSPSVSYVWKSILKGFHKLKDENVWLIGNRKDVSMWLDKWCMDVVLIQMVPELRDSDVHLLVADLILEIGSLACFGLLFLIFVRAWIIWLGILLLMGSFSSKSAYHNWLFHNPSFTIAATNNIIWLWKLRVPEKMKYFV